MSRILGIVGLVVLMVATGVAGAAPVEDVRLPIGTSQPAPVPTVSTVVVTEGDHLWKISAHHLGDDTPDEIIAPYWRRVIEVNTPHLRSGDPDLIYPGEVVELPSSERR
jgi:nucleoid-associated protein YgaU